MKTIRQDNEMKQSTNIKGSKISLNKVEVLMVIISMVILGIIGYGLWLSYAIEF